MIRRHIFMGAAAATVMLSGCSGNDASPSPTPTPTVTPTPTPTASPTYAAFPLAAAAEFTTINATTSFTGDAATTGVTLGAAATEQRTDRVRLATSNVPATGTYVFREVNEETRLCVPTGLACTATLATPSAATNTEFVFRLDDAATAGKFSQVEFLNNVIPSTVTNEALLGTLTRVSYGNWYRGDSTAGQKRLAYTVFGYPTVLTDMPTTGTVAYTSRVVGRVVVVTGATTAINKIGGTANVSVNFATGVVDVTLTLTQTTSGGVTTPYGTVTAQGAIPASQTQFTGSITGGPLTGTIAGGFFGSQGNEIGISFAGSSANARLVGQVVGKKP
ncbi:MAG: hypothetical protein EOP62_12725 [Sphingomonadales bacterium]|nr:MAG: hypothetical protein EOP62_12725 [Sphingomonadales bacterium]